MKRVLQTSLAILLLVANLAGAEANQDPKEIVIDLPGTYIVPKDDQKTITLGELSKSIQAADGAVKKQYESLIVLDAPAPGCCTRLPNHYIIQSIRQAGMDFTKVKFIGERLVEVMGPGKPLEIQEVINLVEKQVLEESGWNKEEMVLRILSVPSEKIWVPLQKIETTVERTSPMFYGTVRFEVRIFIDNIQHKSFPLIASIAHRRAAYQPTRAMQRGDVIGKEDVRQIVQYFDQEFQDRQAVDDIGEVIGSKCKSPINRGDTIKWNNLDVNYVVGRGDLVKILVQSKGITLQTSGKALKHGALGDEIPVRTDVTKHVVKGRVIQRGLVELIAS
jgi:flagella basal body P-ring formation protein FlgA